MLSSKSKSLMSFSFFSLSSDSSPDKFPDYSALATIDLDLHFLRIPIGKTLWWALCYWLVDAHPANDLHSDKFMAYTNKNFHVIYTVKLFLNI